MKVYLIASLLFVLVGCGLSKYTSQDESRLIPEEKEKDFSFDKPSRILSDLFAHSSEDSSLGKRALKDSFNHSHCADLKAHGFCKYSIIKDTYCQVTCHCNDILSRDSCRKIKDRNECSIFGTHCKLTCLKCTCVKHALGMENGEITNPRITASSTHGSFRPFNARLNTREGHGGWAAQHNREGEWLQVDLGKLTVVTGVATQGRQDADWWVKTYSLQYSLDGKTFKAYEGGKVFTGNTNWRDAVKRELEPPISARYIRLVVKTWQGHIALRIELYGC